MYFNASRILYEDNHLIIVNKAPGDIVQGDKTGDIPLLEEIKQYIKIKYNKPGEAFLGCVHRLDRPVSGVVVFARTSKALSRMNELFQKRDITKKYLAIVKEKPPQETAQLTHYLIKDNYKNISKAYPYEKKGSQKAVLDYTVIAASDSFFLLEIDLHTGRHHQIRSQLSFAGFPIKGDVKYGYKRTNEDASISLHAYYIKFVHPISGVLIEIRAPLPEERTWRVFGEVHLSELK